MSLGNTVASFSRVPYEVVKQSLQTGQYPSTFVAVSTMWGGGGMRSFFPLGGVSIQMLRDIPYAIFTLLSYEYIREHWVETAGSGDGPDNRRWLRDMASALSPGQPIYVALYAAAIIFFCFFYTALVFNSRETADNLKKSGAFIPGIRPGDQTARYIDKILLRLTLAGAVYITAVCLLPEFLILKYNVPFYFGGTSLLIIVVVTMDFMAQVQNYMMSQQYESLLKKANFKTSPGS